MMVSFEEIFSDARPGLEKVTLQVYSPAWLVRRGLKVSNCVCGAVSLVQMKELLSSEVTVVPFGHIQSMSNESTMRVPRLTVTTVQFKTTSPPASKVPTLVMFASISAMCKIKNEGHHIHEP